MNRIRKIINKANIYRSFLLVFATVFIVVILGTVFDNKSLLYDEMGTPILILLTLGLIIGFLLAIYFVFFRKMPKDIPLKKEAIILIILMAVFLVLQIIYTHMRLTYPGWDWKDVMYTARDLVWGHEVVTDWTYFQQYPNNYGMLYFELIFFKILNFFGFFPSDEVGLIFMAALNIIMLDIAVLLVYSIIRENLNKRMALFSLIVCIMSYAFYCYTPVLYTDTASIIFPILLIFLYIKFIKSWKYRYLVWGGGSHLYWNFN